MSSNHALPQTHAPSDAFANIDLVIFDFDGVIVDSEVISLGEIRTTLNEFGMDAPLSQIRRAFLGAPVDRICRTVEEWVGAPVGDQFKELWYARIFDRFRKELKLVHGVCELLDILDARAVSYCIASSGSVRRLQTALDAVACGPRFQDRVFSADMVARGKPWPDIFLHALDQMNGAKERTLIIEDSPSGIKAATAAGIPAIGFTGGAHLASCRAEHGSLLMAEGASFCIDRLSEVTEHLS
ncbi:HAD family phosphatase [Rhodophyticola sp. CCM32]|uniref:HAD family hydrolase n=1 Tax=Rhodophyticola sp. CCM32 TaxID=2916397 RepID=UPI00107F8B17|nr:HAD family phosphatase [Rhodophyticola sp. CCM32]QBX99929.1 HAD family phosphatase [Rhodophyticola sp. CCM32]